VIVRPWEAGGSRPPASGTFCFLVRNREGLECEVTVRFAADCPRALAAHVRARVTYASAFWVCCAERHLAEYIWQHDNFPTDNRLLIDCLSPEEIVLAGQWNLTDQGQRD